MTYKIGQMGVTMKAIKKIVKTYESKDGKRIYRQIRFNNGDDLGEGIVYVLTESQYDEVSIYQKKLKEVQQQLVNLKEKNVALNKDLKDLTRKYEGQVKGYNNKIHQLENEKTKYLTLAEEKSNQMEKLEKANANLIKWKEANISETSRLSAKLEDCQEQLDAKIKIANELQTKLY